MINSELCDSLINFWKAAAAKWSSIYLSSPFVFNHFMSSLALADGAEHSERVPPGHHHPI